MPRPVLVRWKYAYASDATQWVSAYDAPDTEVILSTVGFYLEGFLDGYAVVADSFHEHDGEPYYAGLNYIPNGMVVDITVL